MRTHTQEFKDGIKTYGRQFTETMTIQEGNIGYIFFPNNINRVDYSVDTTLCKSVMQKLVIDIPRNLDMSANPYVSIYNIGLNGVAGNEISFYHFNITEKEEQKDTKSYRYTCYDNMIKTMVDYTTPMIYVNTTDTTFIDGKTYYIYENGLYFVYTHNTGSPSALGLYEYVKITYPITIRNYLSAICFHLGLGFASDTLNFTNYNKEVKKELYVDSDGNSLGYTFRDVLDDIAEATGSFICINDNGQIEVRNITNTSSKNILPSNESEWEQGSISGGNPSSSNTRIRTKDYTPIKTNTNYRISVRSSNYCFLNLVLYTQNYSYINTYYNLVSTSINGATDMTINIPSSTNASYMKVILRNTNNSANVTPSEITTIKPQIELGTTKTDFEEHSLDTINEDYFKDKNVNMGEKVGGYNVVVLSRANDSDNLYYPSNLPENPIEFKISDNLILEQDTREDFIQGIYNKINGLEFYTNDLATTGILYYEIGDKFNVSIDSVTYPCLMLSDNFTRTTGLKENIRTTEPQQSVTPYKYASYSDKMAITSKNAKILVDKANASIEQIVEAVGEDGEVTTASIVQAINDSGSQIKLNADKIYINGVTFDQNQKMTMTDGMIDITDTGASGTPMLQITRQGNNNQYTIVGSYGVITNYEDSNGRNTSHFTEDDIYTIYQNFTNDSVLEGEVTPYGVFVTYNDLNNSNYDSLGKLESNKFSLSHKENTQWVKDITLTSGSQTGGQATINGTLTTKYLYVTNSTSNQKSTIVCERTDTGNSIEFGVGAGGVNRGIFDEGQQKWLFYTDGTNVYLDGTKTTEITKATAISQSDFITLNNGFTMKHFNVNKLGNHIFGNMVIQSTNNIGTSNVTPANIKSGYRINTGQYSFCGLATSDWRVDTVGYIYLGAGGDFTVVNYGNASNIKYIVIELNYMTA